MNLADPNNPPTILFQYDKLERVEVLIATTGYMVAAKSGAKSGWINKSEDISGPHNPKVTSYYDRAHVWKTEKAATDFAAGVPDMKPRVVPVRNIVNEQGGGLVL